MNTPKPGTSVVRWLYVMALLSAVMLSSGCQGPARPRLRFGAFWGSPMGMSYTKLSHLGKHSYEFTLNETNGIMYTCKGGFIDIAHVREAADRTAYLQKVAYQNLLRDKNEFSFQVIEPSTYRLTLSYPKDWDSYSKQKKQAVAKEVSIDLGQYLAHTSLIWHEIITWYGFASSGVFPDTISAFSPEDPYSDVLGAPWPLPTTATLSTLSRCARRWKIWASSRPASHTKRVEKSRENGTREVSTFSCT